MTRRRTRACTTPCNGSDFVGRSVVTGALTLYLDFINLFLSLLNIFGGRRD